MCSSGYTKDELFVASYSPMGGFEESHRLTAERELATREPSPTVNIDENIEDIGHN